MIKLKQVICFLKDSIPLTAKHQVDFLKNGGFIEKVSEYSGTMSALVYSILWVLVFEMCGCLTVVVSVS